MWGFWDVALGKKDSGPGVVGPRVWMVVWEGFGAGWGGGGGGAGGGAASLNPTSQTQNPKP